MQKAIKAAALALALLGTAQGATALTQGAVNLRRVPGGAVINTVPRRTLLTVACQGQWCRTSYRGRGGYVSARLLQPISRSVPLAGRGTVFYPTCAAMRADHAAPIRLGRPGYRAALDRDHDGWACRYDRQR